MNGPHQRRHARRTPWRPARSAPRASASAAPSTCSSKATASGPSASSSSPRTQTAREKALTKLLPLPARATSKASSRPWTACRSPSACSIRRCTSSCRTTTTDQAEMAKRLGVPAEMVAGAREAAARVQPDAGPSRLPSLDHLSRAVRHADPRDHRGGLQRGQEGASRCCPRSWSRSSAPRPSSTSASEIIRETADAHHQGERKSKVKYLVGTMIEIPRAALTADADRRDRRVLQLRHERPDPDDVRLQPRRHRHLPAGLPRQEDPAGRPVPDAGRQRASASWWRWRVKKGRDTRPDLKCGICGEHGGDPASVKFCYKVGLNYVSCSPYRVPIARLAAAQAALGK